MPPDATPLPPDTRSIPVTIIRGVANHHDSQPNPKNWFTKDDGAEEKLDNNVADSLPTPNNEDSSYTKQSKAGGSESESPDERFEDEELLAQAAIRSQSQVTRNALFWREKRMNNFDMRSQQAVLDHTFTHMRIKELEKELKTIKKDILGRGEEWVPPSKSAFPINWHVIKRGTIDQFRVTRLTAERPPRQQPALEVQLADKAVMNTLAAEGEGYSLALQKSPEVQRPPERLRIRSQLLLSHIDKLLGGSTMSLIRFNNLVQEERLFSSVVYLRPFKRFLGNRTAIRNSMKEVESELQKETEKQAEKSVSSHSQSHGSKRDLTRLSASDANALLLDLQLLMEFLEVDLKPTIDLRQQIKDGTATKIEYADLWHLFERGDLVIPKAERYHAYRVVSIAGGREPLKMQKRYVEEDKPIPVDGFVLDCISMGSNGSAYVPQLHKISIKKFFGSQLITSLPVYPMRFDPHKDVLQHEYLQGGKRYLDVTRNPFCHRLVRGKTLNQPSHDLDAQVIVDMTLAVNARPEWKLSSSISVDDFTKPDSRETIEDSWCLHRGNEGCCGGDVIHKDLEIDEMKAQAFMNRQFLGPIQEEDLTREDIMLMQHYVHAFVLRSRQWVTVRTADLHDVEYANNFDDFVLPGNHGQTVKALVETHERSRKSPSAANSSTSIGASLDLVRGKGAGLIILLHGPPGVGKTSTAECVADDTRRPLYPITCGDIGESAAEVESNLQYNFGLAHKWGCVLLLDEADVFLAKRTRNDLRHNAVTSVFLRSLEYYAGILFLTTNRVGAIDPAFRSRIQMSLFYPPLNLKVTKEIYKKFIKRAREEQDRAKNWDFVINKSEILDFAKRHYKHLDRSNRATWNGRQIRNAFQTAIALTEHDGKLMKPGGSLPELGAEQFEIVATGVERFDEYLDTTLGATEAEWAKMDRWRADTYKAIPTHARMQTSSIPLASIPRSTYGTQNPTIGQRPRESSESDSDDSDSDIESGDDEDEEQRKRGKTRASKGTEATPTGQQSEVVTLTIEQLQALMQSKQ